MTIQEKPFEKVRRKMVNARVEFLAELAKFSEEELNRHSTEGEWSPLELANHLYVADGLALEEMQRVQSEDNPLIVDPGEEAPRRTREAEIPASIEQVLAGMAARREEVFQYLSELPVEAWERPFRHPTWGQRKFYQLVNILPVHDQLHAQQLAGIREGSE